MTCFGKQISKINSIFLGFLPVSRLKKKKSDIGSSKLQDKIQKPESVIQGLLGVAPSILQPHCWASCFLSGFQ